MTAVRVASRWLATQFDRSDALATVGFACLINGIRMWSVAAAWTTAGLLMLGLWSAAVVSKSRSLNSKRAA